MPSRMTNVPAPMRSSEPLPKLSSPIVWLGPGSGTFCGSIASSSGVGRLRFRYVPVWNRRSPRISICRSFSPVSRHSSTQSRWLLSRGYSSRMRLRRSRRSSCAASAIFSRSNRSNSSWTPSSTNFDCRSAQERPATVVQRQLIVSAAGPDGSPGNMTSPSGNWNASPTLTQVPFISRCVSRVAASGVATHMRAPTSASICAACAPALYAPVVSVRAIRSARVCQIDLSASCCLTTSVRSSWRSRIVGSVLRATVLEMPSNSADSSLASIRASSSARLPRRCCADGPSHLSSSANLAAMRSVVVPALISCAATLRTVSNAWSGIGGSAVRDSRSFTFARYSPVRSRLVTVAGSSITERLPRSNASRTAPITNSSTPSSQKLRTAPSWKNVMPTASRSRLLLGSSGPTSARSEPSISSSMRRSMCLVARATASSSISSVASRTRCACRAACSTSSG